MTRMMEEKKELIAPMHTTMQIRSPVAGGMRGFKLRPLSPVKRLTDSALKKIRLPIAKNVKDFRVNIFEEALNDHI